MNAADRKVRFEIGFRGDDAHVASRVAEVIRQMNLLGIRLEAVVGGTYLLSDHEDPVDSSTVDDLHTVGIYPPEQRKPGPY